VVSTSYYYRQAYAEINLNNVVHNILQIRRKLRTNFPKRLLHFNITGAVSIAPVIKADAYGHGSVKVARQILSSDLGIKLFCVALPEEGIVLRENGIKSEILLLSPLFPKDDVIEVVLKNNLIFSVSDAEFFKFLKKSSVLKKRAAPVKIHLKIDTGMGRVGLFPEEALEIVGAVLRDKKFVLDGIYTHFACANCDKDYTLYQLGVFNNLIRKIRQKFNFLPKYLHAANSAAILNFPESYFNLVRPGLLIYGLYPFSGAESMIPLKPALSLVARVACLREMPRNRKISYCGTYITKRRTKIAVLPIGYADGVTTLLSNKGRVLIRGEFAPIVGRVTMDMIMVDVTHIPGVSVGDEAVIIGQQGGKKITAEDIGELNGMINYEVVCNIASRIPRIYVYK